MEVNNAKNKKESRTILWHSFGKSTAPLGNGWGNPGSTSLSATSDAVGWAERPGWMVDLSFSSTERPSDFLSPAGADVVSGFTGCGLRSAGSHGTALDTLIRHQPTLYLQKALLVNLALGSVICLAIHSTWLSENAPVHSVIVSQRTCWKKCWAEWGFSSLWWIIPSCWTSWYL